MPLFKTLLISKITIFLVAVMLSISVMAEDFSLIKQLASQGEADAQNNLGLMYKNGEGVRQDYTKAVEWYTKAANQGIADAQYNLGYSYYKGEGVRQNNIQAKEWFGKACDNGNQDGCDQYRNLNLK